MVTLDTNSLGQVSLQVGRVSYWGELALGQIDWTNMTTSSQGARQSISSPQTNLTKSAMEN